MIEAFVDRLSSSSIRVREVRGWRSQVWSTVKASFSLMLLLVIVLIARDDLDLSVLRRVRQLARWSSILVVLHGLRSDGIRILVATRPARSARVVGII